jgi:hypothetical protein
VERFDSATLSDSNACRYQSSSFDESRAAQNNELEFDWQIATVVFFAFTT